MAVKVLARELDLAVRKNPNFFCSSELMFGGKTFIVRKRKEKY